MGPTLIGDGAGGVTSSRHCNLSIPVLGLILEMVQLLHFHFTSLLVIFHSFFQKIWGNIGEYTSLKKENSHLAIDYIDYIFLLFSDIVMIKNIALIIRYILQSCILISTYTLSCTNIILFSR